MKKLKGEENAYRLRVGDYRALYEVHDTRLLVLVVKIGHRREVYR
jgi:mRNA interferase RelE/StbE